MKVPTIESDFLGDFVARISRRQLSRCPVAVTHPVVHQSSELCKKVQIMDDEAEKKVPEVVRKQMQRKLDEQSGEVMSIPIVKT